MASVTPVLNLTHQGSKYQIWFFRPACTHSKLEGRYKRAGLGVILEGVGKAVNYRVCKHSDTRIKPLPLALANGHGSAAAPASAGESRYHTYNRYKFITAFRFAFEPVTYE
jgi:hypothetical protein